MNGFTYFLMNPAEPVESEALKLTAYEAVSSAHRFHSGMKGYCPTPLVSLKQQAKRLGPGAAGPTGLHRGLQRPHAGDRL